MFLWVSFTVWGMLYLLSFFELLPMHLLSKLPVPAHGLAISPPLPTVCCRPPPPQFLKDLWLPKADLWGLLEGAGLPVLMQQNQDPAWVCFSASAKRKALMFLVCCFSCCYSIYK